MSKAEHIVFISPRFSERGTVGGAETLLKNLAERAARAGRRVTFLTTCASDHFTWENTIEPGHRRIGNLEVEFFPVDDGRDLETFIRVQTAISTGADVTREEELAWIKNSVNSQPMYNYLREHGPHIDRIVVGPYLFGLTYFASQIWPEKTFLVPCLHDEPFAYLRIMQDMFDQVKGFLFNTSPERDLAVRLFAVPDEKQSIVGMGLNDFSSDSDATATEHGITAPYVIYSGRREPLKGTPLLVDYLHAYRQRTGRDVKLVSTGSGPIEGPDDMLEHVIDLGFVSEQEKHDAMAGAVAFCHPSVNESLGIVLLEAWLAGTPALVHAKGAVLSWQCRQSRGGLWFTNYPEFEEELTLLLDHPELREAMGQSGRKYVLEEYSWQRVEERMLTALDS